jgi:hypothetical protein
MAEPILRIQCAGESALIVYLGEHSSPAVSARVQALGERPCGRCSVSGWST